MTTNEVASTLIRFVALTLIAGSTSCADEAQEVQPARRVDSEQRSDMVESNQFTADAPGPCEERGFTDAKGREWVARAPVFDDDEAVLTGDEPSSGRKRPDERVQISC